MPLMPTHRAGKAATAQKHSKPKAKQPGVDGPQLANKKLVLKPKAPGSSPTPNLKSPKAVTAKLKKQPAVAKGAKPQLLSNAVFK